MMEETEPRKTNRNNPEKRYRFRKYMRQDREVGELRSRSEVHKRTGRKRMNFLEIRRMQEAAAVEGGMIDVLDDPVCWLIF